MRPGRDVPGAVQVLYALIREAIPEAEFDPAEMGGEARGWRAWQQGEKRLGGWRGGRDVCCFLGQPHPKSGLSPSLPGGALSRVRTHRRDRPWPVPHSSAWGWGLLKPHTFLRD